MAKINKNNMERRDIKEVKFIGITKKHEPINRSLQCSSVRAFEVEFNSVNYVFEEEFLETAESFNKHKTPIHYVKEREHRYKVTLEHSDGNVFGILFRKYMAYRNNLWMEIDTEKEFEPLIDFVVELEAA